MLRMFSEHNVRKTASLDGIWQLTAGGNTYSAIVPAIWESIPALAQYRGTAEYTRVITTEKDGNLLLRFGGVSHTADVYLDDVRIGHHYDAFTGFRCEAANVKAGEHTLKVCVDNSFSDRSTLHIPNDYYTYGGITRPVEADIIPDCYIDRAVFISKKNANGTWTADVTVIVKAASASAACEVEVSIAGSKAKAACPALKAGETAEISVTLECAGVKPWGSLEPSLYMLKTALVADGQAFDDLIDRVGFREVVLKGEQLLINDKPVFLKGFNRHEDYGTQGCAVSVNCMMEDLQLMLDMGGNTVRTCHYPNDPRFLDLCDELGVLVWEETHSRAIPGEIMRTPLFAEQIDASATEMVTQHRNHACIYTWGLLNECESETEFGRGVYSHIIDLLHSLDSTRPVTFASCRFFTDICMDLVDICSFNIYPLWYHDEEPGTYAAKLAAWMDTVGAAGKPMIFSEFGAGGIAGYYDPLYKSKWSEERQAEILDKQLGDLLAMERITGTYIWQFADVRVAEEWSMRRPNSRNNKGIVDMNRRPKLAYNSVKKHYTAK